MIGIKRAFTHMFSERNKTILKIIFYSLIFYIFMIMAFVSLVAQKQVRDMEAGVGNAIQIVKAGQGEEQRGTSGAFTAEEIEKLSSHPEVRTYNTLTNGYGNIDNTEPYIQEDKLDEYKAFQKEKGGTDKFMFIGVRTSANAPMFSAAGYELIRGTEIKEDDKNCILVSDKMAAQSGLKTGDKVVLQTGSIYMRAAEPQTVTVKGIYKCPEQKFTEGYQYVPYWQPENQVFVAQETLQKMNDINYPVNQVFCLLEEEYGV